LQLGNEKIEGVERLAYSGNNSTPSVDANPGGSSLSALSSTFLYAQGTAGGGHDRAETPGPHRPGVSSFAQAGPLTAFRAVWCIPPIGGRERALASFLPPPRRPQAMPPFLEEFLSGGRALKAAAREGARPASDAA
jgi:hypothetical protein